MLQANELRIGNWYNVGLTGQETPEKFELWTEALDFEAYGSGIPLTHEIMEKCGFYFNHPFYEIKNPSAAGIIKISFDEEGDDGFVYDFMTRLHYLHQLQTLFFSLTNGIELNYIP